MPLIYVFTLLFGLQFAVIHVLCEYFSLYWRYDWLDMPIHAMGGVLIALALASLIQMKLLSPVFKRGLPMIVVLLVAIIGWELFGIYREQGFKVGWLLDTSTDLLSGTVGFVLGRWFTKILERLA